MACNVKVTLTDKELDKYDAWYVGCKKSIIFNIRRRHYGNIHHRINSVKLNLPKFDNDYC